jgi:lipoate-protein ligase A
VSTQADNSTNSHAVESGTVIPTTPRPWRVVALQTGPAERLLAGGMDLFDNLRPKDDPIVRWYRSDAPAIVLGRGQRDLALAPGAHPVTTRFSGGGAVWLAPDVLSLDVLVPAGHPWFTDQLGHVFELVGRRWAEALCGLGVNDLVVYDGPTMARRRGTERERLLAAVCYATRGRGEVLWQGRKLVGLAQRRRRHGAMVQCGMLRHWAPQHLLTSLGADSDDSEILRAAVGLAEVLPEPPDDAQIMASVESAFGV